MKGQSSFGTGDINLAAALLAIGIPPDPIKPIVLIAKDDGKDYIRFHFLQTSYCGKYDVYDMSAAWSNPLNFRKENPGHPFCDLMDFITERPRGVCNFNDWMHHAARFVGVPIDDIRKTLKNAEEACRMAPESPLSYICAFIRNRDQLIQGASQREKTGNFSTMQSAGKSVSLISAKAPRKVRDFLLSHIR